jgi:ornithine cyclodeaminase/alanine dehydrogenase-like protein (mu-crystallin family)
VRYGYAQQLLNSTLILKRREVAGLLTLDECIPAMESAFAAHALGRSLGPAIMHIDAIGGEFHVKGGGLTATKGSGPAYFALKVNGGFFGNVARGLPSIRGLIALFDAATGDVLAVMDSRDITSIRTAATTALAIRLLAKPDAVQAALCGCGAQARRHLAAILAARPTIRTVRVWSRDADKANEFCRTATRDGIQVVAAGDLLSATRESDVIVTCTSARSPFLTRGNVKAGAMIAAVGADSPDKTELEPALTASSRVVADLRAQCAEVGEVHHAIKAGLMSASGIYAELGELAAGLVPPGWSPDLVTVFDSTGTALQDAAAAGLVYERARAQAAGMRVDFTE